MLLELAGEFCALLDGLFFCTIVIFFSEMLVILAFSLCSRSFGCRMYSISQWFGGIIFLHSGVARDGGTHVSLGPVRLVGKFCREECLLCLHGILRKQGQLRPSA